MAKRRINGLSIADAIKGLESKQQTTLVVAAKDDDQVAGFSSDAVAAVPAAEEVAALAAQEIVTVPEAADEAAKPAVQESVTVPVAADEVAKPAVQESVTAPAAAASSTANSAGAGISVRVVVEKIFSKEVRYKNSRSKPVIISEGYRDCIGLLSELSECEASQIVNNMLSLYFDNPEIKNQLNAFAKSKYKKKAEILMK
jgi:hypothetical protein